MNLYLGGALIAALLAAFIGWSHASSIKREYDLFKQTQQILASKQIEENEKLKKQLDEQRTILEADNARNVKDIRSRYDTELKRLRALSSSAGRMPSNTTTPTVCSNKTDNDRLSNAVSDYQSKLLGLLEQAELQTRTLITCQGWITRQ